jgi:hypothetical protein
MKQHILSKYANTTKKDDLQRFAQENEVESSAIGIEAAEWERYMKEEEDSNEYYMEQERIRSTIGNIGSRKGWVPPPFNNQT